MKQTFPEPLFHVRRKAKEYGISLHECNAMMLDMLENPHRQDVRDAKLKIGTTHAEIQVLLWRGLLEEVVLGGGALHLFVDTAELADFLGQLPHKFQASLLDLYQGMLNQDPDLFAFVLHFCGSNKGWAFFGPGTEGMQPMLMVATDRAAFMLDVVEAETIYQEDGKIVGFEEPYLKAWGETNPTAAGRELEHAIDLIYGLALYLSCFPEALEDGVPDFVKKPNQYKKAKSRCRGIRAVPQVTSQGGYGKAPHLRNGHWRTYRSDRYVNMKGQIKWIKAIPVKGKVKRVKDELEPDPQL